MIEPDVVQEPVQTDPESNLPAATVNEASGREGHYAELIAEARRYRKRAQSAEKSVEDLKVRLAEREQQLQEKEASIAEATRKQELDAELRRAGAIDVDAARILAKAAFDAGDAPDISGAVAEVQRSRPYLFQTSRSTIPRSGVMSATGEALSSRDVMLGQAATEAHQSGRRADLLRYLRLRRQ